MAKLIIEICPREPSTSACLPDGEELFGSDIEQDIRDCVASGDCEPACHYVRDTIGVDFRIVARSANGDYENRPATDEEMAETARAIYFESDADFTDRDTAATYLIWDAAHDFVNGDA